MSGAGFPETALQFASLNKPSRYQYSLLVRVSLPLGEVSSLPGGILLGNLLAIEEKLLPIGRKTGHQI